MQLNATFKHLEHCTTAFNSLKILFSQEYRYLSSINSYSTRLCSYLTSITKENDRSKLYQEHTSAIDLLSNARGRLHCSTPRKQVSFNPFSCNYWMDGHRWKQMQVEQEAVINGID